MKLSDAIEQGSVGMEQGYGMLFPDEGECCAMGAAALAIGITPHDARRSMTEVTKRLEEAFPVLANPAGSNWRGELYVKITTELNDRQRKTFAEIVHWLREKGL